MLPNIYIIEFDLKRMLSAKNSMQILAGQKKFDTVGFDFSQINTALSEEQRNWITSFIIDCTKNMPAHIRSLTFNGSSFLELGHENCSKVMESINSNIKKLTLTGDFFDLRVPNRISYDDFSEKCRIFDIIPRDLNRLSLNWNKLSALGEPELRHLLDKTKTLPCRVDFSKNSFEHNLPLLELARNAFPSGIFVRGKHPFFNSQSLPVAEEEGNKLEKQHSETNDSDGIFQFGSL